jgi:ribosomal subunit interface protein
MQTPLQLTFRAMTPSEALTAHVGRRAEKLDRLFDDVISCHFIIELSGHHHRHGDRFRIRIHVGVPGHELVVDHDPPGEHGAEDARAATDRAFDEADRQLEDWVRRRRSGRHERLQL